MAQVDGQKEVSFRSVTTFPPDSKHSLKQWTHASAQKYEAELITYSSVLRASRSFDLCPCGDAGTDSLGIPKDRDTVLFHGLAHAVDRLLTKQTVGPCHQIPLYFGLEFFLWLTIILHFLVGPTKAAFCARVPGHSVLSHDDIVQDIFPV